MFRTQHQSSGVDMVGCSSLVILYPKPHGQVCAILPQMDGVQADGEKSCQSSTKLLNYISEPLTSN